MGSVQVALVQDGGFVAVPATNVTFKKSAPGGDVSASFRLTSGRMVTRLRSQAEVYISDKASGRVLWYGRVSNPGQRADGAQAYLDVTADGSMVDLDQERKIRPYVVTRFSAWAKSETEATYPPQATAESGPMSGKTNDGRPTNTVYEGFNLTVPKGSPVKPWLGTNSKHYKLASVNARSYAFDGTGYWIGAVAIRYRNYGDSNNWITRATLDNSLGTVIFSDTNAQNEAVLATWYRGRDSSGQQTPTSVLLSFYTAAHSGKDGRYAPFWHDGSGAGNARVNGEVNLQGDYLAAPMDMYASFDRLALVAHLWDRHGQPLKAVGNRYWLWPHEVVEDILGRDLLWQFTADDSYSTVSTAAPLPLTTFDYTEKAVSTRQVLDDLVTAVGGDLYYATLPPRSVGERPGLVWRGWVNQPRYLTTPDAQINLVGSQQDLVNRASVRWRDPYGRVITRQYTAHPDVYGDTMDIGDFNPANWETNSGDPAGVSTKTSLYNPGLGWARIVEAEPIDLNQEQASTEIADSVGVATLRAQARRVRTGTVTVTKVMDLWQSAMVRPQTIEPGYTIALNDNGDVIRVTDLEYDDDAGTAQLSVANPGLDVGQLIAQTT